MQGSLLVGLGKPYGVLGVTPRSAACKASFLPTVLWLQPSPSILVKSILATETVSLGVLCTAFRAGCLGFDQLKPRSGASRHLPSMCVGAKEAALEQTHLPEL